MRRRLLALALGGLLATATAPPPAAALDTALPGGAQAPTTAPVSGGPLSGPALDEAVRGVAAQLRCPICQGLSIEDSPSEIAQQMRAVIRDSLAAGRTPDEVKAYFVSKYGEWILLSPEPHGFNLAVYLLPAAALLGGVLVIGLAVRRWIRPAPTGAEAGAPDPTATSRS
jgi:cytochrome c-type biogenesis protein CcmH